MKMKKQIENAVLMDSKTGGQPWVDWGHVVDLGHQYHGWGKNYLYVWLNGAGLPFYVGQAERAVRPGEFKYMSRTDAFKSALKEGGCHCVVVAKHVPGSKVDVLEKGLIAYCAWKGWPLVNIKDMTSDREVWLAKEMAAIKGSTVESVFLSLTDLKWEYELIFSSLEKVVGVLWDGPCVDVSAA